MFKVNDKVIVNSNGTWSYANGKVGTIVEIDNNLILKNMVKFDEPLIIDGEICHYHLLADFDLQLVEE